MGTRAERAAENEAAFRKANERIGAAAVALSLTKGRTPFICECEDPGCTEIIGLTHEEYEAVRAKPRWFAIAPGHESPDDRVVQKNEPFTVVEKTGEEGEIVEASDPRA